MLTFLETEPVFISYLFYFSAVAFQLKEFDNDKTKGRLVRKKVGSFFKNELVLSNEKYLQISIDFFEDGDIHGLQNWYSQIKSNHAAAQAILVTADTFLRQIIIYYYVFENEKWGLKVKESFGNEYKDLNPPIRVLHTVSTKKKNLGHYLAIVKDEI